MPAPPPQSVHLVLAAGQRPVQTLSVNTRRLLSISLVDSSSSRRTMGGNMKYASCHDVSFLTHRSDGDKRETDNNRANLSLLTKLDLTFSCIHSLQLVGYEKYPP